MGKIQNSQGRSSNRGNHTHAQMQAYVHRISLLILTHFLSRPIQKSVKKKKNPYFCEFVQWRLFAVLQTWAEQKKLAWYSLRVYCSPTSLIYKSHLIIIWMFNCGVEVSEWMALENIEREFQCCSLCVCCILYDGICLYKDLGSSLPATRTWYEKIIIQQMYICLLLFTFSNNSVQ